MKILVHFSQLLIIPYINVVSVEKIRGMQLIADWRGKNTIQVAPDTSVWKMNDMARSLILEQLREEKYDRF